MGQNNSAKLVFLLPFAVITFMVSLAFVVDATVVKLAFYEWKTEELNPTSKDTYKYYSDFQKDLEIVSSILGPLETENKRDAGVFLNTRIEWGIPSADVDQLKNWTSKIHTSKKIELSPEVKNTLLGSKAEFMKLDAKEFLKVDTSWLHKLRDFDYWDIDQNSPLDLYPRFSFDTPFPEFNLAVTKIHLIKAKKLGNKDFSEAVRDVIHYGKLCFTTETLIGEMVFVASLGVVKDAIDFKPAIKSELTEWNELIDQRTRLRRVFWAINQFAKPTFGTKIEVLKKVYNELGPATGLCGAIREATTSTWPLWSAATDAMPDEFNEYQKLVMQNDRGCRLTWLVKKTPPWVKLPDDPESFYSIGKAFYSPDIGYFGEKQSAFEKIYLNFFSRMVHYLPNTRKFISTIIFTVATPTYTKGYAEMSK